MINITVKSLTSYDDWYRREHISLYRKYGKCILVIDSNTFEVVKVYKLTEVRQSLEFSLHGNYIHQYCKETICGITEFAPSISCSSL